VKRALEKEKKKERKQYLSEGLANGTLSEKEKTVWAEKRARISAREAARQRVGHGEVQGDWKGGVVVDLEFDELMTDKVSLESYLGVCCEGMVQERVSSERKEEACWLELRQIPIGSKSWPKHSATSSYQGNACTCAGGERRQSTVVEE
jgi:hypothetical protein